VIHFCVKMPVMSTVSPTDLMSKEVARATRPARTGLELFKFTEYHEPLKRWPFISDAVEKQVTHNSIQVCKRSVIFTIAFRCLPWEVSHRC
jgi:hypothetical protein